MEHPHGPRWSLCPGEVWSAQFIISVAIVFHETFMRKMGQILPNGTDLLLACEAGKLRTVFIANSLCFCSGRDTKTPKRDTKTAIDRTPGFLALTYSIKP